MVLILLNIKKITITATILLIVLQHLKWRQQQKKRDTVIGTLAGATEFGAGAYDSDNYDTIKHPGAFTAIGAVVGAAGGYVAGSNEASKDEKHKKSSVLRQCLLQKGYHVYDIS